MPAPASTIVPVSAYERPCRSLRNGSTAGSAPCVRSTTKCPRARRPMSPTCGRTCVTDVANGDAAAVARAAGFESAMTHRWYTNDATETSLRSRCWSPSRRVPPRSRRTYKTAPLLAHVVAYWSLYFGVGAVLVSMGVMVPTRSTDRTVEGVGWMFFSGALLVALVIAVWPRFLFLKRDLRELIRTRGGRVG